MEHAWMPGEDGEWWSWVWLDRARPSPAISQSEELESW